MQVSESLQNQNLDSSNGIKNTKVSYLGRFFSFIFTPFSILGRLASKIADAVSDFFTNKNQKILLGNLLTLSEKMDLDDLKIIGEELTNNRKKKDISEALVNINNELKDKITTTQLFLIYQRLQSNKNPKDASEALININIQLKDKITTENVYDIFNILETNKNPKDLSRILIQLNEKLNDRLPKNYLKDFFYLLAKSEYPAFLLYVLIPLETNLTTDNINKICRELVLVKSPHPLFLFNALIEINKKFKNQINQNNLLTIIKILKSVEYPDILVEHIETSGKPLSKNSHYKNFQSLEKLRTILLSE